MNVQKAVRPDGSLYLNSGGWIRWKVGDDRVAIDAELTIQELEFIVAHIKAAQQPRTADGCGLPHEGVPCVHCGENPYLVGFGNCPRR